MVFTHTSLVLKYGEVKQEDVIKRNSWKLRASSLFRPVRHHHWQLKVSDSATTCILFPCTYGKIL